MLAFSGSHDLATLRLVPSRTASHGAKLPSRQRSSCALQRNSLRRLLDFLSHSFGGGTDVAAPLRRVLELLAPDGGEVELAGADVLVVSDGELPDPPVDASTCGA